MILHLFGIFVFSVSAFDDDETNFQNSNINSHFFLFTNQDLPSSQIRLLFSMLALCPLSLLFVLTTLFSLSCCKCMFYSHLWWQLMLIKYWWLSVSCETFVVSNYPVNGPYLQFSSFASSLLFLFTCAVRLTPPSTNDLGLAPPLQH